MRFSLRTGSIMLLAAAACGLIGPPATRAECGPDPVFEKPVPVTMAELAEWTIDGVAAVEVNDYAPGHYADALTPSPPHADLNAGKAVVVVWKAHPQRLVFSHKASYCPLLELPSGAAMCNQFFEGNLGEAELFNNLGRREKNSFVELNRWTANRVFYVLLGSAREWDDVRRIGRSWLDTGRDCAKPESIAPLK